MSTFVAKFRKIQDDFDTEGQLDSIAPELRSILLPDGVAYSEHLWTPPPLNPDKASIYGPLIHTVNVLLSNVYHCRAG